MRKCFQILGVREDATTEEIKAAYEKRVKRYKSSDYEDERGYASRKIEELAMAYTEAITGVECISSKKKTVQEKPNKKRVRKSSTTGSDFEKEPSNENTAKSIIETTKTYTSDGKKNKGIKIGGIISTLLAIVALAMNLFIFFDTDTSDEEFIEVESFVAEGGPADYSTYYTDQDWVVYNTAEDVYELLKNDDDTSGPADDSFVLSKEADLFAKNYYGMENFEELRNYVVENYKGFEKNTEESFGDIVDRVITAAGFMPYQFVQNSDNPFTHRMMPNKAAYLHFINQFYDEIGLSQKTTQELYEKDLQ